MVSTFSVSFKPAVTLHNAVGSFVRPGNPAVEYLTRGRITVDKIDMDVNSRLVPYGKIRVFLIPLSLENYVPRDVLPLVNTEAKEFFKGSLISWFPNGSVPPKMLDVATSWLRPIDRYRFVTRFSTRNNTSSGENNISSSTDDEAYRSEGLRFPNSSTEIIGSEMQGTVNFNQETGMFETRPDAPIRLHMRASCNNNSEEKANEEKETTFKALISQATLSGFPGRQVRLVGDLTYEEEQEDQQTKTKRTGTYLDLDIDAALLTVRLKPGRTELRERTERR